MKRTHFSAFCALALMTQALSADETENRSNIRFNEQIRPILSEYCFACHGPDSASRKAELRLDNRDDAMNSAVIIPGSVEDSELIARITSDDPSVVMPPPRSRKTLTPEHKQLLARWIEAGAEWEDHWAFIKPRKTKLPQPEGAGRWARNPIDLFVVLAD